MAAETAKYFNISDLDNSDPKTTLELSLSCKGLKATNINAFCIFSAQKKGVWVEVGRTERIANSSDPTWTTTFIVDYWFEERQNLRFEVFNVDEKENDGGERLATLECTLGKIASSPRKHFVKTIAEGPSAGGKFEINAKVLMDIKEMVKMQVAGKNISVDKAGETQIYFTLSKKTGPDTFKRVLKSNVVNGSADPVWKENSIPVWELCNGDKRRTLKVEFFVWDDKDDVLIGSFETTMDGLTEAIAKGTTFPCVNAKKLSNENYKNSGEIYLKEFKLDSENPSFLDYIQGGTELKFSVAIDFTASNGKPADPKSLHYCSTSVDNEYITSIRAIGEIIQDYDNDHRFPAFGFGARVPPRNALSHNFCLNLSSEDPNCDGVDGILRAYQDSLNKVTLYGPTNFAPVIEETIKNAKNCLDGRQYHILVIITDGVITDMDETRDAIVAAAKLPVSIIIVGVGNEDFEEMEILDGDNNILTSPDGTEAERDIVQFIEMRRFLDKDGIWNKKILAKEVLEELPQQLVDWMVTRGIKPPKS